MIEVVLALGVCAIASFTFAFARPEMRVARRGLRRTRKVLRTTTVSRIAELTDGKLACIVGTVEAEGTPLISVLSRKACVAYEIVEWRKGVRRKLVPFYVSDGSGRVRIDAPEAALLCPPSERGETFEERVIAVGATIRIVGSVRLEATVTDGDDHHFRDHAKAATLTGTAKYPLLVDVE